MNEGWSIKKLIRSIVLSHTYQLSSDHDAKSLRPWIPANRYLWRMERRRLDAEEIRDAMLVASGQLDLERPEGSPVMELGNGPVRGPSNARGSQVRQRAQHLFADRSAVTSPEILQVFDAADPSLIVGKRDVTTVPTQALFLMNNPFVLQQSTEMAKRILAEKDRDQSTRIDLAYRYALTRLATKDEHAAGGKIFERISQGPGARGRQDQPADGGLDQLVPDPYSNVASFATCIDLSPLALRDMNMHSSIGRQGVTQYGLSRRAPVEGGVVRLRLSGPG